MIRWLLEHPASGDAYTFPMNPNDHDSMFRPFSRQSRLEGAVWTPPRAAQPWSFSGNIYTVAQRDELARWVADYAGQIVLLTDDLGQTITIRLISFEPAWRRAQVRRSNSWTYTMSALIVSDPVTA